MTASAPLPVTSATSVPERRVMLGKGWYDQQELAMDAGGSATPSGIVGTLIPHPDLGEWGMEQFAGPWWAPKHDFTVVAYVGLDATRAKPGAVKYYKDKFNYDPMPVGATLDKLNKVSLCYGTRFKCSVSVWSGGPQCKARTGYLTHKYLWVKLEAAGGGEAKYRCGIRRDHGSGTSMAHFVIPTARWRWLITDETVWDYCAAAGCCETAGDLF